MSSSVNPSSRSFSRTCDAQWGVSFSIDVTYPITVRWRGASADGHFSLARYKPNRACTISGTRLPSSVNSVGLPSRLACQSYASLSLPVASSTRTVLIHMLASFEWDFLFKRPSHILHQRANLLAVGDRRSPTSASHRERSGSHSDSGCSRWRHPVQEAVDEATGQRVAGPGGVNAMNRRSVDPFDRAVRCHNGPARP